MRLNKIQKQIKKIWQLQDSAVGEKYIQLLDEEQKIYSSINPKMSIFKKKKPPKKKKKALLTFEPF